MKRLQLGALALVVGTEVLKRQQIAPAQVILEPAEEQAGRELE